MKKLHLKSLLQDPDRCASLVSEYDGNRQSSAYRITPGNVIALHCSPFISNCLSTIHLSFRNHARLQSWKCAACHHGENTHDRHESASLFSSSWNLTIELSHCLLLHSWGTCSSLAYDASNRQYQEYLFDLAGAAGLERKRAAMAAGEHINSTEDRAVMHIALRAPRTKKLIVDGADVVPDVHAVLSKVRRSHFKFHILNCEYLYGRSLMTTILAEQNSVTDPPPD